MANVLFTRTSDPSSKPITDGQLIFDTSGNGKMYLDNGTTRLEMGGAIDVDATLDANSTNPIQNKAVAGVMLSTLEEIDKVTSKGKLTDALATKELNKKVTDNYISKGKILGSLEEVTTATDSGFVPDALAIKELDTDLQGQIDTLNSNLIKTEMKTAMYEQVYTVSAGDVRTVTITLNDLKLSQTVSIDACIAVNASNNSSLYSVSNTQWIAGTGSKVYLCNNSNVSVNIPISFIVFYK